MADWRVDLAEACDLENCEKQGYAFFLGWFENWRLGKIGDAISEPNRDAAVEFWNTKVRRLDRQGEMCEEGEMGGKGEPRGDGREQGREQGREEWQLAQWGAAMKWYLRWLDLCKGEGLETRSIAERLKFAVMRAQARKGHARRTRASYGAWAARFGVHAGTVDRAMDPAVARDFLSELVQKRKCSYSTQQQALCALAFYFKHVCGMGEVDLKAKRRKTPKKEPVVLNVEELLALIEKLAEPYQLPAKLQAGSGLRREELVNLRIKDVDIAARTVTVRRGKGGKDRITVLPESLVVPLQQWKARIRKLWEADRAAGRPGVALPGAMERKMSRAGERWEWFWLFITSSVGALRLRFARQCPL